MIYFINEYSTKHKNPKPKSHGLKKKKKESYLSSRIVFQDSNGQETEITKTSAFLTHRIHRK